MPYLWRIDFRLSLNSIYCLTQIKSKYDLTFTRELIKIESMKKVAFSLKYISSLPIKWQLIFSSALIGLLTGSSAVLFYFLLQQLSGFLFQLPRYYYLIFPAIGATISAVLIYRFAPEAEGHGIDAVAKAFHQNEGYVPIKVSIVKAISSIFTLGFGGSGGVEGPIAQIGSGIGSKIARVFRLDVDMTRSLMLARAAGGIGAIFKAPLGGAFASIEIIYREDFEARALIPAIISSISGYFIYLFWVPGKNVLNFPQSLFKSYQEFPAYIILAIICVLMGAFFVKFFYLIRSMTSRLKISIYLKPAIGGLLVGLIGFFFPRAMGANLKPLIELTTTSFPFIFILTLLFLKLIATCFTIGTGGSGGVFGPSLFIGGMTGAMVHQLLIMLHFPLPIPSQTAFVLVGMAGFFLPVLPKRPLAR